MVFNTVAALHTPCSEENQRNLLPQEEDDVICWTLHVQSVRNLILKMWNKIYEESSESLKLDCVCVAPCLWQVILMGVNAEKSCENRRALLGMLASSCFSGTCSVSHILRGFKGHSVPTCNHARGSSSANHQEKLNYTSSNSGMGKSPA